MANITQQIPNFLGGVLQKQQCLQSGISGQGQEQGPVQNISVMGRNITLTYEYVSVKSNFVGLLPPN